VANELAVTRLSGDAGSLDPPRSLAPLDGRQGVPKKDLVAHRGAGADERRVRVRALRVRSPVKRACGRGALVASRGGVDKRVDLGRSALGRQAGCRREAKGAVGSAG